MIFSINNFLKFCNELDDHITVSSAKQISSLAHRLLKNYDQSVDVRKIDLNKLFNDNFANLKNSSKRDYLAKINAGLKYFSQHLNGEKIIVTKRNKLSERIKKSKTFTLHIPIRDNLIIINNMPVDITEDEAQKIVNILSNYTTRSIQ